MKRKVTVNERRILHIQKTRRLYSENPTIDYISRHRFHIGKNLVSLLCRNANNTVKDFSGSKSHHNTVRQEEFGSDMWIAWVRKLGLRFVTNHKSNSSSAGKLISVGRKTNASAIFSIIIPNKEPHLDFMRLILHTNFGAYTLLVANNLNVNNFLHSIKSNNNVLFLHYVDTIFAKTSMFFVNF